MAKSGLKSLSSHSQWHSIPVNEPDLDALLDSVEWGSTPVHDYNIKRALCVQHPIRTKSVKAQQQQGKEEEYMIQHLNLDLIRCDWDILTRDPLKLNPEQISLFEEMYRDDGPGALPPVVIFHDADDTYWLADGFYRLCAAREALPKEGPRTLPAEVHEGTKRDALWYAAGANGKHGQSLSANEKRIIVERLLKDPEWRQKSDRAIARHTGTSHVFVGGMRKCLEIEAAISGNDYQMSSDDIRTVQRGDQTYQMHTTGIGHGGGTQSTTAPASTNTSTVQDDDGMEAVITEGLDELMDAWEHATYAARRTFRDWVLAQPIENYRPVAPSEQTQRFYNQIVEICKTDGVWKR